MTIVNPAYDFLKADYDNPNLRLNCKSIINEDKTINERSIYWHLPWALPATTLFTPINAMASTDTFQRIKGMFMTGADYLFTFVVIFAGASWMLGNRSKAIELIIGAAAGWLIISHSQDILAILKTI